jgi:hypothetical protein
MRSHIPTHICTVNDYEIFDDVLNYVYARALGTESKVHPLFMSEPAVSACARACVYIVL